MKEKYPGLTHNRIPVCNSAAPLEADLDTIVQALLGTNVNALVIVNCQVIMLIQGTSDNMNTVFGTLLMNLNTLDNHRIMGQYAVICEAVSTNIH